MENVTAQRRFVKILIILFIIIPLIVSSVAFLRENPSPKPGPAGESRFSNFNPMLPNMPQPPVPPPELVDIMNYTIGYTDRNDVFLRLWSGNSYVDGKWLPYYTNPTLISFTHVGPESTYIMWNVSTVDLLAKALSIPKYVPSYVMFPSNATYTSAPLEADQMRQLYLPGDATDFFDYDLYFNNASEIDRRGLSSQLIDARSMNYPRMNDVPPLTPEATAVADALHLPDDRTVYEQVAVVLAYMYGKVAVRNVTSFDNPLQSLTYGYASINDWLSTFVTLLRLEGVPANVVYGFIPENSTTEDGMYIVKIKDIRMFVEIYDAGSRILFDPRTFTPLMLYMMGKYYPINVYHVTTNAEVLEESGGDAQIPLNDTIVPVFYVDSEDYSNYLYVLTRATVMGAPIETDNVTVIRYNLGNGSEMNEIDRRIVSSNASGIAEVYLDITAENAEAGVNVLVVSYNGRTGTGAFFLIVVSTTIGGEVTYRNYIYGLREIFWHEALRRTYLPYTRIF